MLKRMIAWTFLSAALVLTACGNPVPNVTVPPAAPVASAPSTAPSSPSAMGAESPNVQVAERIYEAAGRRVVRLANGLTVILQENHTAPVVAARIYVRAGSLTEQEFMGCGISHVLEHLVAGGTSTNLNESQSQEKLKILGGDSNAFTTFDRTCYFITTTSDKWPIALELLANWTTKADFTPAEFQREYQVVQREIEMGEAEADRTFYKLVYANRYQIFPAKHPIIGYKTAFQKLTVQDCRTYYQRMYVPDNLIVSIAGDIQLDEALQQVQTQFAAVSRQRVPAIALPPEPPVSSPRLAVAHADVRSARVDWSFPTVDMHDQDMYALDVLAGILAAGDSSLLVRTLRDEQGLVTGISAADNTPYYAPGALMITAELPPSNIAKTQQAVLEAIEKIKAHGVSPEQVQTTKAQVAAGLVYSNQTAEQQATHNGEDFLATNGITFSTLYVERINQVTPEQVDAVARKYLRPEVLLTTILLPLKASDQLAGLNSATQTTSAKPVTELVTLPNGLRVLIGRNPAAPLVSFQYFTLGALLAENESSNGIGNAMMQLLTRGTATRSHEQIAEFLDSTGGELDAVMGNNTFTVKATALKAQAQPTFQLFADVLLHPAFADSELKKIMPLLVQQIESSTEDWFGEGYRFLRMNYYKESPYQRLSVGKVDVVTHLTPALIQAHYAKYFLNPSQSVLAIYGDIDPVEVRKWIEPLGQIPKPTSPPALAKISLANSARTVTQATHKKSAAIFFGYAPGMVVTSPDRHAMTILKTLLAGYNSPGGSILHETLRGQGLVYTVQANNIAGPVPGMFMVMALGQPENTQKITSLIQKIMTEAKAGGFTEEQLATAKDQAITGEKLSDQTIAEQAATAALDELMGLGYQANEHTAENLGKVTREDVIRVANKYLQEPVIAISTPTAK